MDLTSILNEPVEGGTGVSLNPTDETLGVADEADTEAAAAALVVDAQEGPDFSGDPASGSGVNAISLEGLGSSVAAGHLPAPLLAPRKRIAAAGGVAKAEQVEKQLATLGNFNMIAPLRLKRGSGPKTRGVMKLDILSGISSQLASDTTRHDAGLPTCIVVQGKFIAVGTSHGLIMVFDHFNALKIILGSASFEHGPVCSLDMTVNSEWLVAGYQTGTVVLWDVIQGVIFFFSHSSLSISNCSTHKSTKKKKKKKIVPSH
jgi:hypothetical protein